MMTSFAFIFGLLPLVVAAGAGALSRRAVGTPVFGGMIAASAIFGIFVIPMLYVVFQWMRENTARSGVKNARPPHCSAAVKPANAILNFGHPATRRWGPHHKL